jgi:hypothetical protein
VGRSRDSTGYVRRSDERHSNNFDDNSDDVGAAADQLDQAITALVVPVVSGGTTVEKASD